MAEVWWRLRQLMENQFLGMPTANHKWRCLVEFDDIWWNFGKNLISKMYRILFIYFYFPSVKWNNQSASMEHAWKQIIQPIWQLEFLKIFLEPNGRKSPLSKNLAINVVFRIWRNFFGIPCRKRDKWYNKWNSLEHSRKRNSANQGA